MITPSIATLNVRGLAWLEDEASRWFKIYGTATGVDKADAKQYLDAVLAEKDQRAKQYSGGLVSVIGAGISAPFEMLGGSGGAGAYGLATSAQIGAQSMYGEAKSGAKTVLSAGKTVLLAGVGVALIVGIVWARGQNRGVRN